MTGYVVDDDSPYTVNQRYLLQVSHTLSVLLCLSVGSFRSYQEVSSFKCLNCMRELQWCCDWHVCLLVNSGHTKMSAVLNVLVARGSCFSAVAGMFVCTPSVHMFESISKWTVLRFFFLFGQVFQVHLA